MNNFNNVSPKASQGLDLLVYKNAQQLKKDAILIANNRKSYSTATSLLILSSEEVIKSIFIKLHIEGYDVYRFKEASQFFSSHKIRHQAAQIIEMGSGILEPFLRYKHRKPTNLIKTEWRKFNDLVNGAIDVIKTAKPLFEIPKRIKELQSFNSLKNDGFYVNYRDEIILPKEIVTQEVYDRTVFLVDRVFRFSKLLRILYNKQLEKHLPLDEINSIKDLLKDFINNELQELSFKELNKSMESIVSE